MEIISTIVILIVVLYFFGGIIKKSANIVTQTLDVALDGAVTAKKIAEINIEVWAAEQRVDLAKRAEEVKDNKSFDEIMDIINKKGTAAK